MSKLKWDQSGEKRYETGLDHGVLYPMKDGSYPLGVAWNGLISADENPSGAEETKLYADNIPYLSLRSAEEYGLTLNCYTYPEEWAACNGESEMDSGVILSQQRRIPFGLCYRTKLGNDTDGEDYGFLYHLVYGCTASPSTRSRESVNDNPDAIQFSFEISTVPVDVPGKGPDGKPYKPVSEIKIDSTKIDPDKLKILEAVLFGTDEDVETAQTYSETDEEDESGTMKPVTPSGTGDLSEIAGPRLPLPEELKELLSD